MLESSNPEQITKAATALKNKLPNGQYVNFICLNWEKKGLENKSQYISMP